MEDITRKVQEKWGNVVLVTGNGLPIQDEEETRGKGFIKVIFQQHTSRPGCEVLYTIILNYYYCIQYRVVGFFAF